MPHCVIFSVLSSKYYHILSSNIRNIWSCQRIFSSTWSKMTFLFIIQFARNIWRKPLRDMWDQPCWHELISAWIYNVRILANWIDKLLNITERYFKHSQYILDVKKPFSNIPRWLQLTFWHYRLSNTSLMTFATDRSLWLNMVLGR
jgi:hypothetical protein